MGLGRSMTPPVPKGGGGQKESFAGEAGGGKSLKATQWVGGDKGWRCVRMLCVVWGLFVYSLMC
jgi:hypothetical protein